jgi:hypothetical protein
MIKRVIVESPYAGAVDRNTTYARRALRDSLLRGEAPIASHLLYTQPGVLDDTVPEERRLGMDAGLAWGPPAESTVVYTDYGTSNGMSYGIQNANVAGRPVEYREIGPNPPGESLLAELVDLVIWMSGSSDFGREGQAGKHWAKKGLPLLTRALKAVGSRAPKVGEPLDAGEGYDDGAVGG